jgi:NAD(P)-dependent dehydrogenase (short-subunit alcohol dehydrogenase family)
LRGVFSIDHIHHAETGKHDIEGVVLDGNAFRTALQQLEIVKVVSRSAPSGKNHIVHPCTVVSFFTGPVTGFPGWAHYGATKAGQLGFMRTACIELAKYGITVNAVLPGNVLTEGLIALGPEYERSMAASIPLKKLGTVEDIGYAALFLASKEAGYITGQTIIIDGGQILPESLDALAQLLPLH